MTDTTDTTRRALLGGVGLAMSAAAIGSMSATKVQGAPIGMTPFRTAEARYRAAEKHFNAVDEDAVGPVAFKAEESVYFDALEQVDTTPVATWEEFADAYKIACDDGHSLPPEKLIMKLYADVCRLSGGGRA